MIIGRDLIRSLGIYIHGADMTIHRDDAAIPLCDIDSTTNDAFALYHYNVPFNSTDESWPDVLNYMLIN